MVNKLEIVSGDPSRDFWAEINSINAMSTGDDIQDVLYLIGCKMQELESEIGKLKYPKCTCSKCTGIDIESYYKEQ